MFRCLTVICINMNRSLLREKILTPCIMPLISKFSETVPEKKDSMFNAFCGVFIYQSLHYHESGIHVSATFFHDSCKLSYLKTPSCFAFGRIPHLAWFVHVKFRNRLDKTYPTFKSCFATEKLESSSELSNS